jgi:hypothetical protein
MQTTPSNLMRPYKLDQILAIAGAVIGQAVHRRLKKIKPASAGFILLCNLCVE